MINKSKLFFVFAFLSLFVFNILGVYAEGETAEQIVSENVNGAVKALTAFFKAIEPLTDILFGKEILNVTVGTTSFVAVQILLLVIVFAIVYVTLDSVDFFSNHKWALVVLSFAVSILSVRTLSDGMISGILLPYQGLGIALTAALPFLIYFIFVEIKLGAPNGHFNSLVRRTLWIFLGVIYLFIYIARKDQLGTFAWIYFVTFLIAVLMCFIDGTIQGWLVRAKGERTQSNAKSRLITQKQRELWQVNDDFSKGVIDKVKWEAEVKRLKKEIADIAKG